MEIELGSLLFLNADADADNDNLLLIDVISDTTCSYSLTLLVNKDNKMRRSYLIYSSLTFLIFKCNLLMNVAWVSMQSKNWMSGLLELIALLILSYLCLMFNCTKLSFDSMNSLCLIL